MMRRAVLILLLLLALLPLASSQYRFGGLEVLFTDRGAITVSRGGIDLGTSNFRTWGPGWTWASSCSEQSGWNIVKYPAATETTVSAECSSRCEFAAISWSAKAWIGLYSLLVEINATAADDSRFAGVAWDFELPIAFFKGNTVYALFANGSTVPVKLREEHVPENWTIAYFSGGAGWIVPLGEGEGLLIAVFGDVWPNGMDLEVQDFREWGGTIYALRNWLFFDFYMTKGQRLRILAYMHPYVNETELEEAKEVVKNVMDRLSWGESLSTVKNDLIAGLELERAAIERRRQGPPPMLIALLAFIIISGTLLAYVLLKGRRS